MAGRHQRVSGVIMPRQRRGGKRLRAGGGRTRNEDCCCVTAEPCIRCNSGTTPAYIRLRIPAGTLSGTGCSAYEGEIVATQQAILGVGASSACVWNYLYGATISDPNWAISKNNLSGGTWRASLLTTSGVAFTAFELTGIGSTSNCDIGPTTLTWTGENAPGCPSSSGKTVEIEAV